MNRAMRLAGLAVLLAVTATTHAGTAYSPKKSWLEIWEPFKYEFTAPNVADKVEDRVHDESQGYKIVYRRYDDDASDTTVGTCTRTNWDAVPVGTGVVVVVTHGNAGFMCGVGVGTVNSAAGDDYAQAWKAAGSDNADMIVDYWDRSADGETSLWTVDVYSAWYGRNWQADHNSHRAIVVLVTCHGSEVPAGGSSVLSKVGGRVRIGWPREMYPTGSDDKSDVDNLFGRMNGRLPAAAQGSKRKFGDAWGDFPKDTGITYQVETGGLDTTLCPSVESVAATCGVCTIVFDTHCDDNQAIGSVVSAVGTNATVGTKAWADDHTITIDYTKTGDPARLAITIDEDFLIQKDWTIGHKLNLDGNQVPETTTPADADGVAANEDDYEKTVTLP